jgi:hypothetical protein
MSKFPKSFRGAPPESILTIVVMDSGFVAARRPGMTKVWEPAP